MYYLFKVIISAIVVVLVSEVAKRSSIWGALLAALPLTSLLAITWMWTEKVEISKITNLSSSIFWLVLPSLLFFIIFPVLLKKGVYFWFSFIISSVITILAYIALTKILNHFGIKL